MRGRHPNRGAGQSRKGKNWKTSGLFSGRADDKVDYQAMLDNHFDGTRRAGDIPHTKESKFKTQWMRRRRDVRVIPLPDRGSDRRSLLYGTNPRLPGLKMSYNFFSQNPWLQFHLTGDGDSAYFPINFEMLNLTPADQRPTIERLSIAAYDMDSAQIFKLMKENLGINIDLQMGADLARLGSSNPNGEKKGLECFTMVLNCKLWLKRPIRKTVDTDAERMVLDIQAGTRFLVVREESFSLQWLDKHYDQLLYKIAQATHGGKPHAGIYPFYTNSLNQEQGARFKKFFMKPEEGVQAPVLPHMPWMGVPNDPLGHSSFAPLKWFSSTREFETVLSAAVVHDRDSTRNVLNALFNENRTHHVEIVAGRTENQWLFHVQINKTDKEKHIPVVSVGTWVTVKRAYSNAAYTAKFQGESSTGAMDLDKLQPSDKFIEHRGRVVNVRTNSDFVVSCMITPEENQVSKWVKDNTGMAQIKVDGNTIPSDRMLEAIAGLASLPEDHFLHPILFAKDWSKLRDVKNLDKQFSDWKNDPEILQALKTYTEEACCNPEQTQAVANVFTSNKGISVVQGPPGTGKSTTIDFVAVTAAARGIKVSVSAPSNVATDALACDIAIQSFDYRKHLGAAKGQMDDSPADAPFKVVYVPTRAQAGRDLIDAINWATEERDLAEGNAVLESISLAKHLHLLAEKKSQAGNEDAIAWLALKAKLFKGEQVTRKELAAWKKTALSWAPEAFKDPEVKIVISTCNNHGNPMLGTWSANLVIINEAASALEPDVDIVLKRSMLTLMHVMNVGDHQQLIPVVTSLGLQEWSSQLQYSFFKRMIDELIIVIPFVMLKENYRMHPNIAEFPSCVAYQGLLCNEHATKHDDDPLWIEWENFLKDSVTNFEVLRRRGKWWDGHSNSWRRVFFNTAGFSSPRPGELSLQNFANINYIVEMLAGFGDRLIRRDIELEEDEFVIQVPYVAQKNELCRQIRMRCRAEIANWVVVKTIDSNQGGQSTLSWICLTPANEHHGSQVGFLDRWNRLNVALTRAKAGVAIFGNIDRWFLEFEVFYGREKLRNWALLMADLMVKGDIADIYKIQGGKMKEIYAACLPTVGRELRGTQFWSKMQQHCPEVALSKESRKFAENSNEQTRTQAFNDAVAKLASLKDSALESLKLIGKAPEIDAEESQEAATMEES